MLSDGRAQLLTHPVTSSLDLVFSQRTVLPLPLDDGGDTVICKVAAGSRADRG